MENREIIVQKALKKMGLSEAVDSITKLSNYEYRVILYGPIYNVFVYKTKNTMKADYNVMTPVDGYYVYFQDEKYKKN